MEQSLLPDQLNQYLDTHTNDVSELLSALEEETKQRVPGAHMISGQLQGNLLSMISMMLQPKCILEIGTYTGYAALCLASGLTEDGTLYSIEKEAAREDMIHKYWEASGFGSQMKLIIGDAHSIVPTLNITPDLVFLDADKKGYAAYYDLLLPLMPHGGVILADNVLFHGEVATLPRESWSKTATHMHHFNEKIKNDPRVEVVILPLRDGISLIRKK